MKAKFDFSAFAFYPEGTILQIEAAWSVKFN